MKKALLKHNIKSLYKYLLIFLMIFVIYDGLIIYMYDPEMTDTLVGFINTYLNGFFLMILPMLYVLIITGKLVTEYIDTGSLSCIMATPNSRTKIIVTQLVAQILGLFMLILLNTVITVCFSQIMFPGELNIPVYLKLIISIFFIHMELGSVMFLAACIAEDRKKYFFVSAGIPLVFYIIYVISGISDKLNFLQYLTIFSLFNGDLIIEGIFPAFTWLFLLLSSCVLYLLGIFCFRRRDLYI